MLGLLGLKKFKTTWGQKSYNLCKADLANEAPPYFEAFGVPMEYRVPFFRHRKVREAGEGGGWGGAVHTYHKR